MLGLYKSTRSGPLGVLPLDSLVAHFSHRQVRVLAKNVVFEVFGSGHFVSRSLQNTKTNLEVSLVSDLQRKFRGMLARRQVFEKVAEPSLEEGVTDLQRAFRGIQARKQVFEKVAESSRPSAAAS